MSEAIVLVEQRGQVRILTLNRPDRLNAWTDELESVYFAALREAEADPGVRAIVVTGAGRGFCAGADMDLLAQADAGSDATQDRTVPAFVDKPLIAAVNGAAAGIGLVQALLCDLRFTTPEAKWTTAFAQRGLVAEYGVSWLLPRIVGRSTALDLLMSSRVVTGREAVELGLADRLVESGSVVDEAVDYAERLATLCSPWSMATMKKQVRRDAEGDFCEAVGRSMALMSESFGRPDLAEGVASFVERRAPEFDPLAGA